MAIDLSGPLFSEFNKSKQEYENAKSKGDIETANLKAALCAKYLRKLAKNSPQNRANYLKNAENWEKIASGANLQNTSVTTRSENAEINPKNQNEETDSFGNMIDGLISKSNVTWGDIGGLENVKRMMMETIVIAGLQKPDAIKPWKGVLLFGPPGTGKTMLAAASAGSLNATFFNVQADKVLSKYFGESAKIISSLYSAARTKSPSIVFIDEFDAISLSRGEDVSEASRRMLSTLLAELDGFQDKKSDKLMLTLAATNTPWDLDQAVLSRFPKRIYVTLPDEETCKSIIKIQTTGLDASKINIEEISNVCVENNYSGRDLSNLCQQAIKNMTDDANPDLYKLADLPYEDLKKRSLKVKPLEMTHFERSFEKVKSPLTKKDIEKYENWNEEFGEK